MSTVIDERVVELRFDNKQFESATKESMSTLEKLKTSLNFEGAQKGFDNLDKASRSVKFTVLSDGIETVKAKFDALEVVGLRVLQRITDTAFDAGKKLVKSLSVDQITAGFDKYTEKTESVQTLVNSTGKSVGEINEILDKLMWYSDETSYSFTEMVSAMSQMVAGGAEIEKMPNFLMGIANATAFAGKSGEAFTHVIRNITQAYNKGYMQAIDWTSIELQSVNSKQLIETLIAAGEAAGTLEKGTVNLNNFRESLRDKWMTKEVMETGFGAFAQMMEDAYVIVNDSSNSIDTATEAIDELSGSYEQYIERATRAAQESKSFKDAVNATKDAVSSGWMSTFELIFGDYEKATELWSAFGNELYDVFAAGSENRNSLLETALYGDKLTELDFKNFKDAGLYTEEFKEALFEAGKAGNEAFEKMSYSEYNFNKLLKDGYLTMDHVKEAAASVGEEMGNTLANSKLNMEEYSKAVNDVWRGVYGNGEKRFKALEAAGFDPKIVQALVDGMGTYGDISEKLWNKITMDVQNASGIIDGSNPYDAIIEGMKKTESGLNHRQKLLKAISMSYNHVKNIVIEIENVVREVFPATSADQIQSIIDKFFNWASGLHRSYDEVQNLRNAIKPFLELLKKVIDIVKSSLKILISLSKEILPPTLDLLGKIANVVGETLVVAFDWLNEKIGSLISTIGRSETLNKFTNWIKNVSDFVKNLNIGSASSNLESFTKYAGLASESTEELVSRMAGFEKTNNIATLFTNIRNKLRDFFVDLNKYTRANNFTSNAVERIVGFFSYLANAINKYLNIDWSEPSSIINTILNKTILLWERIFGPEGFMSKFKGKWSTISSFTDSEQVNAMQSVSKLESFFGKLKNVLTDIKNFFVNYSEETGKVAINWNKIFDIAKLIAEFKLLLAAAAALRGYAKRSESITNFFRSLSSSISLVSKTFKKKVKTSDFIKKAGIIFLGITIIVGAIYALSKMYSSGLDVNTAIASVAIIIAAFGGLLYALNKVNMKKIKSGGKALLGAASLIASIGLSIFLISQALVAIKDNKIKFISDEMKIIGLFLAVFSVVLFAMRKADSKTSGAAVALLAIALAITKMLDVIQAVKKFLDDFHKISGNENKRFLDEYRSSILVVVGIIAILTAALSVIILSGIGEGRKINGFGLALVLLSLVGSLYLIFNALVKLEKLRPGKWKRGFLRVFLIIAMLTGAMGLIAMSFKNVEKNINLPIVAFILGIGEIILAVIWLGSISDKGKLVQGLLSVFVILTSLSLLIYEFSKIKTTKGVSGTLIATTLFIAAIVALGIYMSKQPFNEYLLAMGSIIVLLAGIGMIFKAMSKIKTDYASKWLSKVLLIFGVLASLAVVAGALMLVVDRTGVSWQQILAITGGIMLMMFGLAALFKGLNNFVSTAHVKGNLLRNIILISSILVAIGGVLAGVVYLTKDADPLHVIVIASSLGLAMIALATSFKIIDGCAVEGKKILGAMVILTIAFAAIGFALVGILKLGGDVDPWTVLAMAISMSIALIAISKVMKGCAVLGAAIGPVLLGALAISAGILIFGAAFVGLIALLNWLGEQTDFLNNFINVTAPLYILAAEKLGEMIGSFIGGIGVGYESTQLEKADLMVQYAEKMSILSDKLSVLNVTKITSTVSDLKKAVNDFIEIKWDKFERKLEKSSKTLGVLADSLIDFSNKCTGFVNISTMNVVANIMNGMAALFDSLGLFTNFKMENVGSLLGTFGEDINDFCKSLDDIDAEKIDTIVDSLSKIPEVLTELNNVDTSNYDAINDAIRKMNAVTDNPTTGNAILSSIANISNGESKLDFTKWLTDIFGGEDSISSGFEGLFSNLGNSLDISTIMPNGILGSEEGLTEDSFYKLMGINPDDLTAQFNGLIDTSISDGFVISEEDLSGITVGDDICSEVGSQISAYNFEESITIAISNIVAAMEKCIPDITDEGQILGSKAIDGFASNDFEASGEYAGTGFANGANRMYSACYTAGCQLATATNLGYNNTLDINSPSKVAEKSAGFYGLGIVTGLKNSEGMVFDAASYLGDATSDGFASTVSQIYEALEDNVDNNPVISPILDLTNIEAESGRLDSMFGNETIGLNTTTSFANGTARLMRNRASNDNFKMAESNKTFTDASSNNFYITGSNAKEIADEVSSILKNKYERKANVWA